MVNGLSSQSPRDRKRVLGSKIGANTHKIKEREMIPTKGKQRVRKDGREKVRKKGGEKVAQGGKCKHLLGQRL